MKKVFAIVICLGLLWLGVIYAVSQMTTHIDIGTSGVMALASLEVREVSGPKITSIDWDITTKGIPKSLTYELWNIGDVPLTVTMTHTLNSINGTLTWDAEGKPIGNGAFIPIQLTLTMTGLDPGISFNFNITITGTEQ